jgi:hypothetical protein
MLLLQQELRLMLERLFYNDKKIDIQKTPQFLQKNWGVFL